MYLVPFLLLCLLLVHSSTASGYVEEPKISLTPVTVCAVSAEVVYTDTSIAAKEVDVTHVDVVNPLTSLTTIYQTSVVPIRRLVYETVTASPQYIEVTDVEIVPTTVFLPATRVNTVFNTLSVTEVEIVTEYSSHVETVFETVTNVKTKYLDVVLYQTSVGYVTKTVPKSRYTTVVEAEALMKTTYVEQPVYVTVHETITRYSAIHSTSTSTVRLEVTEALCPPVHAGY